MRGGGSRRLTVPPFLEMRSGIEKANVSGKGGGSGRGAWDLRAHQFKRQGDGPL